MTKNLSIKIFSLLALSFLLGLGQVFAQSTTTGGIGGTVTDPQGSVVPSATITVTNIATNGAVTVTTTDDGGYRVTNLQPGVYRIEVTVAGFAPAKADNITVEVGRSTPVDIPLTLGTAVAEVNVTAEAPVVNTNDNANASNFDQTQINELPINGRRWSNFALLSPTAVPDGTFGLISFRGISGLLNNNTIDGGDNNQAFFSEERGRTRINYSISQASIREFQVNTSNYSAEYGRSAGGVTNAVTKSGTNKFHGEAFYYNRNNRNGARNPLQFVADINQVQRAVKPVDLREQFGGNVGGPIIKDKLFFFFNYDQQRRNFPGVARFTQPNFLTTITTAQRTILTTAGVTDAQVATALAYLVNQTGETPRSGDQKLFFPKIDWQINGKNLFTASYNRLRWQSVNGIQTQATNTRGRSNFGDDFVDVDSFNTRLQSTITSNLVNEFRFQYGRDFERQISSAPLAGEPLTALGGTRSPNIFITNGLEMGTPTFLERGRFPDEKRYQFADTVTNTRGRHTVKFGGDINKVTDDISNLRFQAGAYSYTGAAPLADFVLDFTNWKNPGQILSTRLCPGSSARMVGRCYNGNYQQGIGSPGIKLGTWDYNFFVQDDYRMSSRVTINLGLRYEYIKMPKATLANTNTTGALLGSFIIPNDGRTITQATSTLPNDKNNFGPRVGMAIDLTGDGKTSLRAGYGIYYGRIQSSTIYNALVNTGNPGGQGQYSVRPTDVVGPGIPVGPPIFPNILNTSSLVVGTAATAIQFFDRNFHAPLINQYDVVFEREIMANTAVSVSYIGSLGRSLPTFFDLNNEINPATPTTTYTLSGGGPFDGQTFTLPLYRRVPGLGNQAMTRIQSTVKSEYNALVFSINRRFTKGLQMLASYTFAKSTDTDQNSATFSEANSPYDILNGSFDRGPSSFDTRHKIVLSGVWAPNFYKGSKNSIGNYVLNGWSLAPNFNYYSGRPFSGNVNGTSLNNTFGDSFLPVAGRNAFRLPSLINLDVRLSKRFKFRETMSLEFLAEAFNVANRTHVFGVNTTLYSRAGSATNLTYNTSFGQITGTDSTLYRERQIQFATRFQF
ncbi:MAG: TonB-dependent receptor [Acidobacteriota bacterium]